MSASLNNNKLSNASDDENESYDSHNEENTTINNNSTYTIEEILNSTERLLSNYKINNDKIKKTNLVFTKDEYTKFSKLIENINKEHCLFSNQINKKSLKNCIGKKKAVKNKRKVWQEIVDILELKENMLDCDEIKCLIPNYIKEENLKGNNEIYIEGLNKQYFNIFGKLKLIFEFIKEKVNEFEKDKSKIEDLFPDNKIPSSLMYKKLFKYYSYFYEL